MDMNIGLTALTAIAKLSGLLAMEDLIASTLMGAASLTCSPLLVEYIFDGGPRAVRQLRGV